MNSKLPDLNLYLDASGRFSKNDSTPLVIAGFAIESCKVQQIRNAILTVIENPQFKWVGLFLALEISVLGVWLVRRSA